MSEDGRAVPAHSTPTHPGTPAHRRSGESVSHSGAAQTDGDAAPAQTQLNDNAGTEERVRPKRSLGLLQLLAVIYVTVSGGAYGFEPAVKAAGGMLLLLGILILFPLLWALPVALACTELSTSMSSNASHLGWINASLPPWVTPVASVWTFALNCVDTALYPNLFSSYVQAFLGDFTPLGDALTKTIFTATALVLNMIGVELVGNLLILLCILANAPFVCMFIFGFPSIEWSRLTDSGHTQWGLLVSVVTWNFTGYDTSGHVAEEVKRPNKTFPRAMMMALFLPSLSYFLPCIPGVGVAPDYSQWTDGYWVDIGTMIAGRWLGTLVTIGGCVAAYAYMLTHCCTGSRALQNMATLGIMPRPIAKYVGALHKTRATPICALCVMGTITLICTLTLNFEGLIILDAILYSLKTLMVITSFLMQRICYPTLPRPYCMRGPLWALSLLFITPMAISIITIILAMIEDEVAFWVITAILVVSCGFGYWGTKRYRPHGYFIPDLEPLLVQHRRVTRGVKAAVFRSWLKEHATETWCDSGDEGPTGVARISHERRTEEDPEAPPHQEMELAGSGDEHEVVQDDDQSAAPAAPHEGADEQPKSSKKERKEQKGKVALLG